MEIDFLKPQTSEPPENTRPVTTRLVEFFSSFGMMLVGVILLFVGSITVTAKPVHQLTNQLPRSDRRVEALGGGDLVYTVLPVSRPTVPVSKNQEDFNKPLTARAVLVVDDDTGNVLFKKNSTDVRPLASISKLMSALVLNQLPITWTSTTVVISQDFNDNSRQIKVGEKYTLEDLWNVALIGSSNSAILSLVRNSGLTSEQFVTRMNSTARELGLTTLRFDEPTGLSSDNLGSARDVARLLEEALKVPRIADTLRTSEYYIRPLNNNKNSKARHVWSTDWLLTRWIPHSFAKDKVIGKTGFINDSGYNFAVRFTGQNNHSIRVVILGAESNESRFTEARDLAEWIFAHYIWPDEIGYGEFVE